MKLELDAKKLAMRDIAKSMGRGMAKKKVLMAPGMDDDSQEVGDPEGDEAGGCTCKSCPMHGASVSHGVNLARGGALLGK